MHPEIRSLLRRLEPLELDQLRLGTEYSYQARLLLQVSGIGIIPFCEKMQIKKKDFRDFICGAFPYTLDHVVRLETFAREWSITNTNITLQGKGVAKEPRTLKTK